MKSGPIPYFTIEGTVFEVDIERQVLIERANRENMISFIDQMVDKGTHYVLVYDLKRKNEYDKTNGFYESEDWTAVRVPRLVELDPEGMAKKYAYTVEQLQDKTDFEVIVDQVLLKNRLDGALPEIDICGTKYYIDIRVQELRAVAAHWERIDLKILGISMESDNYVAFYHPELRQVVNIDPNLTVLPEDVVMIEIPQDPYLDPVAVARQYDLNLDELLRRYPIQKVLKAETFPLSYTILPSIVERNLRQKQVQKDRQEKRFKNKPRL